MKQVIKDSALLVAGLAFLGMGMLIMPATAENVSQTVETFKVDVDKLSTGYRASKMIGDNIVNDANETIGKIDDLIISPDDNKSAYVIISVGGWLGMGTHMIALPYASLHITNSRILLPNVTKDGLRTMPEFKYSTL